MKQAIKEQPYVYDAYYAVDKNMGQSYYDVYFSDNPEDRILPMEYRLMDETVKSLLKKRHLNSENKPIEILDFGAGNGRSLPFYFHLMQKLENPRFLQSHGITQPIGLKLKLLEVAWPGLTHCEDILRKNHFQEHSQSMCRNSSKGYVGSVFKRGNSSVQTLYSSVEDPISVSEKMVGKPDIAHAMFGVFSSICSNAALKETSSMLARCCKHNALVVVGAEGRFPDELAKYDALRNKGEAKSVFKEDGVIEFSFCYPKGAGELHEVGKERLKLFSFNRLEHLFKSTGWEISASVVVDTQSPVLLSKDKEAALEDERTCLAINESIKIETDPKKQNAIKAMQSKSAFHIGVMLSPT